MKKLLPSSLASCVLALGVAAAGCGTADVLPSAPSGGEPGAAAPAPTPEDPTTTPPAPPVETPVSRAKCGAAPYAWVASSDLGAVLEEQQAASHTVLELNYVIYEAAKKNAFKTTRLAKHNTRSRLVRYQTQDRGKLVDATTLMAHPADGGTYPIMLILHGTAGFTDACAPSHGAKDETAGFTDDVSVLLSIFASFGYVAVAPDYIGLKSLGAPTGFMHPYLVGEPTALASLDAVRAAKRQLTGSNVTPGDLVVMGGSQGGHAAAFVNRFQPHYAPELPIKGSVWDVPPVDLIGEAKIALASWTNSTKNMVVASTALESWYHSAPGGLGEALAAPYDTAVPAAVTASCSPSNALDGASLETVFTAPFRAASQQPGFGGMDPWACYLAENSLDTTTVPKLDAIPSLFLVGELDALVSTPTERAAFQRLCAQGHVLQYLECAGATHTKPLSYAFDQWIDFLEDRLDGKPVADVCNVHPAETCTSSPDQ